MKHFALIGLASAAFLALSMGAAAPAQAKVFFSFGVGHGFYHPGYGFHDYGHYYPRRWCSVRPIRYRVRHHHHWVWVTTAQRVCY